MSPRSTLTIAVCLALGLVAGRGWAQEALPAPPPPQGAPKAEVGKERSIPRPDPRNLSTATLRVQVVILRSQDGKKEASLPYTFVVGAKPMPSGSVSLDGAGRVKLRMGVETPVRVTSFAPDSPATPVTSYQYKNIGTDIDCTAGDMLDGRYQLALSVENSSVHADSARTSGSSPADAGAPPLFRSFSVSLYPILRDGQTIQTVASTDPVTGEVVKIDVTLNVVK